MAANPDLQLHHMHDAHQDRLMIAHMTNFSHEVPASGAAYEQFLTETLHEGAPIFLLDASGHGQRLSLASERHFFQHAAPGGATLEEYLYGSERVEA